MSLKEEQTQDIPQGFEIELLEGSFRIITDPRNFILQKKTEITLDIFGEVEKGGVFTPPPFAP